MKIFIFKKHITFKERIVTYKKKLNIQKELLIAKKKKQFQKGFFFTVKNGINFQIQNKHLHI